MKHVTKRLLGFSLALLLLFGCLTMGGAAVSELAPMLTTEQRLTTVKPQAADELMFNEDGTYKLIQVTDTQEILLTSTMTKDFLKWVAAERNPDLFVLTGDNISAGGLNGSMLTSFNRQIINTSIDNLMKIFDDIAIPTTMVLGNHDTESTGVTRWQEVQRYMDHPSYVGYAAAGADDSPSKHWGTHNLLINDSKLADVEQPVTDAEGNPVDADGDGISDTEIVKKPVPLFALWMFDSGDYVEGGYNCVSETQVRWFTQTNNALGKLPSLAFQHIVVQEIFDVLPKAAAEQAIKTPLAVTDEEVSVLFADGTDTGLKKHVVTVTQAEVLNEGYTTQHFASATKAEAVKYEYAEQELDRTNSEGGTYKEKVVTQSEYLNPGFVAANGSYYKVSYYKTPYELPVGAKGVVAETPCPSYQNHGQYTALTAAGNVQAMFFGHDHVNTFEIPTPSGMKLINTPTTGFGSYGSRDTRGVRVITLIREKDEAGEYTGNITFETELVTYADYAKAQGSLTATLSDWRLSMMNKGSGFMVLDWITFAPWIWFFKLLGL
ncbi:MAG: metallophosphoesterase [Oscillospiraceae bacterium]|nr:metallophosphoesterase [Oscillospiraceae bacterium]